LKYEEEGEEDEEEYEYEEEGEEEEYECEYEYEYEAEGEEEEEYVRTTWWATSARPYLSDARRQVRTHEHVLAHSRRVAAVPGDLLHVWPIRVCPPRHRHAFEPSFLECNGIL